MRPLHRGSLAAAGTVLVLCLPAAASGTDGTTANGLGAVHAVSSLHAVSAPPKVAGRAMRWSRQPRLRALATGRPLSGPTVVGLDAGADARELASEYGLSVRAADPALRSVVLDGDPAALGRLAAAIGVDTRLRYVSPPRRMAFAHDRADPLSTTVDPRTKLPYQWAFEHLGVDRALNVTKGDPNILVGIVDSGFGPARDLNGKIASSWYFPTEATDALDTEGHGTFVSSIVAAPNDDGYGLAGFCGACRLDVFKNVQLYDYQVAAAVRQLVDDHVRIINLSLGSSTYSYALADAVDYAIAAGVLVVASSGNDGTAYVSYPAALLQPANGGPSLGLAVGASKTDDRPASFSNGGTNLSLLAPGSFDDGCALGVWAALPARADEFDSGAACATVHRDAATGERYAYANGTSFSAPEVAGIAALVWASKPELTAPQVAQILEQSATRERSGWAPDVGWGVVNAARAVELATGRSAGDRVTVSSVTAVVKPRAGRRLSLLVRATWQDGVAVKRGRVACSASLAGRTLTSATAPFSGGNAVCAFRLPQRVAGRTVLVRATIRDAEGTLGIRSRAFAVKRS